MKLSRKKQKDEAIKRMRLLHINETTIDRFERDDVVLESMFGVEIMCDLSGAIILRIEEFEGENNALVYHVIREYTDYGETECYLYVSNEEDEWDLQKQNIAQGEILGYVYNCDTPDESYYTIL